MVLNPIKYTLIVLTCIPLLSSADEKELKKLAQNLYISEQYAEAAKLFHQLIQSDSSDRMNHYFYGVSLLQSGGNREEAIRFLESSVRESNTPVLAQYYLAKAYQLAGRFDKAIQHYRQFKLSANEIYIEELKIDEQMAMCARAKTAMENKNEITLQHSGETTLAQFAVSYNEKETKSRLLAVPERIRKGRDKNKFSMFLFVDESGKWLSYSGPGKNSGKEIFIAKRKNSNEWQEAMPVKFEKPFPFAAENPVITGNGTCLHFVCNSFNSIGGFDVYESRRNAEGSTWSYPEPLPVPVNSQADEMIFIPFTKEKKAVLLSNRNSPVNQSGIYYLEYPFGNDRVPVADSFPVLAIKNRINHPDQTEKAEMKPEETNTAVPVKQKPEEIKTTPLPAASVKGENQKKENESDAVKETKITLSGFFYDAARAIHGSPAGLRVKTEQGVFRSFIEYPSGEFAITLPASQHYEITIESNISFVPAEIILTHRKDSCTIVLISKKAEAGYALAVFKESEIQNDSRYSVQLGAFREKTTAELISYFHSKGIENAEVVTRQNIKIVLAGKNLSLTEALKNRKQIIQAGFTDAFIVMRQGNEVIAPVWDLAMNR